MRCPILIVLCAVAALGASDVDFLSPRVPVYFAVTSTGLQATWTTALSSKPYLEYFLGSEDAVATATILKLEPLSSETSDERNGRLFLHRVELEYLQDKQNYTYRVSDQSHALPPPWRTVRSPTHRRADDMVLAITRSPHDATTSAALLEPSRAVQAVLMPGSLVAHESSWTSFDKAVAEISDQLPVAACMGDLELHDTGGLPYFARFATPGHDPAALYHSFDIGHVHVVSITTGSHEKGAAKRYETFAANQREWLEEDLWDAVENRQYVPWIVVLVNGAIYSREATDALRRDVHQLFIDTAVDLVFSGEQNFYERTHPIGATTQIRTVNGSYENPNGPVYANLPGRSIENPPSPAAAAPWWRASYAPGHVSFVEVHTTYSKADAIVRLHLTSHGFHGEVLDSLSITKTPFTKRGECGYRSCIQASSIQNAITVSVTAYVLIALAVSMLWTVKGKNTRRKTLKEIV